MKEQLHEIGQLQEQNYQKSHQMQEKQDQTIEQFQDQVQEQMQEINEEYERKNGNQLRGMRISEWISQLMSKGKKY
jgi:uncharacterized damage-inducible protein DinB